jgi:hypothetical protein
MQLFVDVSRSYAVFVVLFDNPGIFRSELYEIVEEASRPTT